ncbi:MAG: methyltransferase domain-containing protein [Pseudomonadota bacterium]
MTWDPKTYLAFEEERTRAAHDLLARTPGERPQSVVDLGCGPGNSTALLRARWPGASIVGVDLSEEMLKAARQSGVDARWERADIESWKPEEPIDILYSNAALQWTGAHETLFPRLLSFLAPGGVLAVQMPDSYFGPARDVVAELVREEWSADLSSAPTRPPVAAPEAYFDWLAPDATAVDIWRTAYQHVFRQPDAVFHWVKGAALTPHLKRLDGAERIRFEEEARRRFAAAFPPRPTGEVLFEFHRIFIVATAA